MPLLSAPSLKHSTSIPGHLVLHRAYLGLYMIVQGLNATMTDRREAMECADLSLMALLALTRH